MRPSSLLRVLVALLSVYLVILLGGDSTEGWAEAMFTGTGTNL